MNCNFDVNPDIINQVNLVLYLFSCIFTRQYEKPSNCWQCDRDAYIRLSDKCWVYNLFSLHSDVNADRILSEYKLGDHQSADSSKKRRKKKKSTTIPWNKNYKHIKPNAFNKQIKRFSIRFSVNGKTISLKGENESEIIQSQNTQKAQMYTILSNFFCFCSANIYIIIVGQWDTLIQFS